MNRIPSYMFPAAMIVVIGAALAIGGAYWAAWTTGDLETSERLLLTGVFTAWLGLAVGVLIA